MGVEDMTYRQCVSDVLDFLTFTPRTWRGWAFVGVALAAQLPQLTRFIY